MKTEHAADKEWEIWERVGRFASEEEAIAFREASCGLNRRDDFRIINPTATDKAQWTTEYVSEIAMRLGNASKNVADAHNASITAEKKALSATCKALIAAERQLAAAHAAMKLATYTLERHDWEIDRKVTAALVALRTDTTALDARLGTFTRSSGNREARQNVLG